MKQTRQRFEQANKRPGLRKLMRQFGRDEDGSMIVFSVYLLILMLILGGMAVDFMRFESRRAMLQGVSDRAALAAANLQADRTDAEAKAVAIDYFKKAGMDEYLTTPPVVNSSGDNFRSVQINAGMDLGTYFLKLVGIPQLTASAASRAIEGVGNVEISLVVDISGSMKDPTKNEDGSPTGDTKMEALQDAATAFVTAVLHPDYTDKISVSLVPYSQHVNAGPRIFNGLNMNHRHDFSHCVEFPDTAFSETGISTTMLYEQGQHVQTNRANAPGTYTRIPDVTMPVCPRYSFEQITPVTQNLTTLTEQIDDLEPRAGTSIFMGLKWGLALLDDSMQPVLATGMDAAFAGRPVAFGDPNDPNRTSKVIVLMTDGENQWSSYLKPEFYDTPSEYANWNDYNWPYYKQHHLDDSGVATSDWFYDRYNAPAFPGYYGGNPTDGDMLTQNLCNAARQNGVIVYSIAFEASAQGDQLMASCATTSSHFFRASGGELKSIFESIAAQITELRLTL